MAGGRRNINRSGSSKQHAFFNSDDSKNKCSPPENISKVSPKHMPMPSLPHDSNIMFEVIMFVYTGTAVFLQFLHLYRSVWWLPNSNANHAMNLYLIDPHLVGFIVTILVRRLIYGVLTYLILHWAPAPLWTLLEQLIRLFLLGVVMTCLVWCAFHVMRTHPLVNIFYLCYPISVYFILFGLSISPFFDVNSIPSTVQDDYKNRLIGKPLHSCSSSPSVIREEVENLRCDFNNRMRQILFSSMLNAYYAGFIPCCFAQNYLYYDVYWATQHLTFIWIGCFTMYLVHCYPVNSVNQILKHKFIVSNSFSNDLGNLDNKGLCSFVFVIWRLLFLFFFKTTDQNLVDLYCDTLHRAALHLGKWVKVEGRACHLPSHVWTDSILWQQGALVKYCKEFYKAEGISNAAEPGNSYHTRFYSIFHNPAFFLCSLVGLQISFVLLQLVILMRTSEWYKIMSISLLLFANHYPLFKLARDYLICWKVYKAEAMIQDKANGG